MDSSKASWSAKPSPLAARGAKGAVQYGWVGVELRTVDYLNAAGYTATGTPTELRLRRYWPAHG